jgi:hypothetical protein
MFLQLIIFLAAALPLRGQTNTLPALLPPYGELPPTFWEQHGTSVGFAGFGVAVLAGFGLWLVFRPKPKIIISPEVQARAVLENLRRQPEDGAMLSRVSQVVRHYFRDAFRLPPGELTTTEFCREISRNEKVGAELSAAAVNFLRESDARKFSATVGPVKLDAASQALCLVEQAEQRRAQLRQSAGSQPQGSRA